MKRFYLALPFSVGFNHLTLSANTTVTIDSDNNQALLSLLFSLRAMNNAVCDEAANSIEASMQTNTAFDLHLRSADLDHTSISTLANALKNLGNGGDTSLTSFSVSYNAQIGDAGAVVLAHSLPNTIDEIGFVKCGMTDEGALALLQWAKETPTLKMICIEGNLYSQKTRTLYEQYSKDHPGTSVYV